jgi:hypothetical protein
VPWCPGALLICCSAALLLCSAPPLLCSSAAWIPSFFVCQQPVSSANTSRAGSLIPSTPLPSPPLPSLLSFTRQFHFLCSLFTSPPVQARGRQIGPNLGLPPPWAMASSNGAARCRRGALLPGLLFPGRLFQGPVTICDAPPYWLRPRPVAWIARSPGLHPGRLQTLHSRRI